MVDIFILNYLAINRYQSHPFNKINEKVIKEIRPKFY